MADKKKKLAETTIRVYADTKEELKELKIGNEGDAVVIARVLEERKQYENQIAELKDEKAKLYELLSFANVPKVRVNTFTEIIESVVNGSSQNQLQVLKDFFNSEILTVEVMEVREAVANVKNQFANNEVPNVLVEFESYVNGVH